MPKLPFSFYQNDDVVGLAQQLLGKQLFTLVNGKLTGGTIVETEAYRGVEDKACHAYGGKFTPRTSVMFESGGIAYVYLCYGIHHLLNVVTAAKGVPHAVLIRAVEPIVGVDTMLIRRNMTTLTSRITSGPGTLTKAFGIDLKMNAKDLLGEEIWIEDNGVYFSEGQIVASPRIGVAYAAEHALLPWRFHIKGNKFVSKSPGKH